MLKFSVVLVCFAVVTVDFRSVNCMTEEEKSAIIEILKPVAVECAVECGLTKDDYKNTKSNDDMDPCFKKCFLIKVGFLDENGKYNREGLHEALAEYTGDKGQAKKVQDQLDSCFEANGDNTGDDEESQMKRVDVLFNCLKEIKE